MRQPYFILAVTLLGGTPLIGATGVIASQNSRPPSEKSISKPRLLSFPFDIPPSGNKNPKIFDDANIFVEQSFLEETKRHSNHLRQDKNDRHSNLSRRSSQRSANSSIRGLRSSTSSNKEDKAGSRAKDDENFRSYAPKSMPSIVRLLRERFDSPSATVGAVSTIKKARMLRPVLASSYSIGISQTTPSTTKSPAQEKHERVSLALVRTMHPDDIEHLLESFEYWTMFQPGTQCAHHDIYEVDLLISFSRTYDGENYPSAVEALERIRSLHESTGGWDGCIRSIKSFGANILPEEDLYDSALSEKEEGGNRLWVNGPNRQFERTVRHVQSLGEEYATMFIMEPDTFPISDGWLDKLLREIQSRAPFALLGSKYDGDAWDAFAPKMPLALLHHINGNAVYNMSHPLLENIISELEAEAGTFFNAIPYDYRISQILLEGSLGISPDFPYDKIMNEDGSPVVLHSKREKFATWWDKYSKGHEPMKESATITNFGTTAYLPNEVSGASIVHGNNMYMPWNDESHGSIALVVSDWDKSGGSRRAFMSLLNSSEHPFSEIIFMNSGPTAFSDNTTAVQSRQAPDYMDLCEADVKSDWFLMTDVFHTPSNSINIMFAIDESNRPVIPYTLSEEAHCFEFKSCLETMAQAREFFPAMNQFMLSGDVLFHTSLRNKFCEEWKKKFGEKGEHNSQAKGLGKYLSAFDDDGFPRGPVATSYIAYAMNLGIAENMYLFRDIVTTGAKRNFIASAVGPSGKQDPDPTTYSMVPDAIEHNLADVASPSFLPEYDDQEERTTNAHLPLFWHIPKSGGTTAKTAFSYCLGLTQASTTGADLERERLGKQTSKDWPDSLRIVSDSYLNTEGRYVNVNLNTASGVARAGELDLIGSGLSDVVATTLLHTAAKGLYSAKSGRRANAFTLLRHPVERAVSLFFYLQYADWESTWDPSLQNMTIEEYATSNKAESNWMVRMLNDNPTTLGEHHLKVAKEILRRKFIIGLTSQMETSMGRFQTYFRWETENDLEGCNELLSAKGENSNIHQTIEEGSKVWKLLASKNDLDMKLYIYAAELFEEQGQTIFNMQQEDMRGDEDAANNILDALAPLASPDNSDERVLIIKEPNCPWLGGGLNAISILNSMDQRAELEVTKARHAVSFQVDGPPSNAILRVVGNPKMTMHVMTSTKQGAPVGLLEAGGELYPSSEPQAFSFRRDGTIGPAGNDAHCVGIKLSGIDTALTVVPCGDKRRIVLASAHEVPDATKQQLAYCQEQEEQLESFREDASARCSNDLRSKLREDGFVKLESAVSQDLVKGARKEINRLMGSATQSVNDFKSQTGSGSASIVNLVKKSVIPFVLNELLGEDPDYYRRITKNGQIALRFPGDHCIDGSVMTDPEYYRRLRTNWHIDGCASSENAGRSDFFGEIRNFNVLIGVLLSDVEEPMSGELALYPGSHYALAEWFQDDVNVQRVKEGGVTKLPHNETENLFHRPAVHCTGKAGDVFILNHMTAHFVASNTSPDVRYAVYFRLSNADFVQGDIDPMINPWRDWKVASSSYKSNIEEDQRRLVERIMKRKKDKYPPRNRLRAHQS